MGAEVEETGAAGSARRGCYSRIHCSLHWAAWPLRGGSTLRRRLGHGSPALRRTLITRPKSRGSLPPGPILGLLQPAGITSVTARLAGASHAFVVDPAGKPRRSMLQPLVRTLVPAVLVSIATTLPAQIQPHGRLDGEMLPIAACSEHSIDALKNGRKHRTKDRSYEVRPSDQFAEGRVEISDVQFDLDPLKDAPVLERSSPSAIRFRYSAKVTSDRNLSPCYALLTFTSEGSLGTHLIEVGKLSAGSPRTLKAELRSRVDSVGSLHVFSAGSEVRSNQHPEAYDLQTYTTELTRATKGLPAAELLKFETPYPHELSRDGNALVTVRKRDGKKYLIVYDLVSMKLLHQSAVAEADDAVNDPTWVSNHEIAFVAEEDFEDFRSEWKLKLLDVTTGKISVLIDNVRNIIRALPDRPNLLVLHCYEWSTGSWWMNYDVHARKSSKITEPAAGYYLFDRNGVARVSYRFEGATEKWECKPTPDSRWRDLDDCVKQPGLRFNLRADKMLDRIADVHSVGPDGDTLYISTRLDSDKFQLAAFSMSEGVVKRVIAKHPKYDLTLTDDGDTRLLFAKSSPELLGIIYEGHKPQVVWLQPGFAAAQKSIDRSLPEKINVPVDWSDDGSAFIYFSYSDQDPGTYYVFRPLEATLIPLLEQGERLKGKSLARMTPTEFTARDGARIPGYVTRPGELTGPAPLVVVVHGGPMVRDSWGFDPMNQFLASRGYIVLQVNYRGSSGYGAEFQKAGLHARLDTVVLDDIADAVKQLISQGEVDASRVAIIGASFGGWATYMSLIKYPDLYHAGVAISAVAHWKKTLRDDRWKFDNKMAYKFWKSLLDRENFSEDERHIDPYVRAAELKQPIYIMHGEQDWVVSPTEAKLMMEKLRKTNPDVHTRSFPNSSHSYWRYDDRVVQLNEIASFLNRYLQPSAPVGLTAK